MGRDRSRQRVAAPIHAEHASRMAGRSHYDSQVRKAFGSQRRDQQRGKADLSLMQPGSGKPDLDMRLDPADFVCPAGGSTKPLALVAFIENGIVAVTRNERTDPITHFAHEGGEIKRDIKTKRSGYTTGAAKQSWTWSRDPATRENLGLGNSLDIGHEKYSFGADGVKHYNMWGTEDLLKPATKKYLKCERPPPQDLIRFNNKAIPSVYREANQRDRNNHGVSDRIWGVMRDEAFVEVQRGESPEPGHAKQHRAHWKDKLKGRTQKEYEANEEQVDLRAMEDKQTERYNRSQHVRSSQSLPPDRALGPQRKHYGPTYNDPTQWCPSPSNSEFSNSKAPSLSMASPTVSQINLRPRSSPGSGTVDRSRRALSARDGRTRPSSSSAAGSMTARNVASRSDASLSFTNASLASCPDSAPVRRSEASIRSDIMNASLPTRGNSAPKSQVSRDSRSSMQQPVIRRDGFAR